MHRAFIPKLQAGIVELDVDESHHLTSVLRVAPGEIVEIFDEIGATAQGQIEKIDRKKVVLRVDQIEAAPSNRTNISVFSAIPKGERADWMIEKLSEVGCDKLTLLRTSRSVTVPKGAGKWTRWRRIAIESAKQCRRVGVMTIRDQLVDLKTISDPAKILSKGDRAPPGEFQSDVIRLVASLRTHATRLIDLNLSHARQVEIFIGPEGDFSDDEYDALAQNGAIEVSLTPTVMRVETAAVVACSTVSQMMSSRANG